MFTKVKFIIASIRPETEHSRSGKTAPMIVKDWPKLGL